MPKDIQSQAYSVAVRYNREYGDRAIAEMEKTSANSQYSELWSWVRFYIERFQKVRT